MAHVWHSEGPEDIALRLKTNLVCGLTVIEAQERLQKLGLNALVKQKQSSPLKIFFQQFNSLVIWVLLVPFSFRLRLMKKSMPMQF